MTTVLTKDFVFQPASVTVQRGTSLQFRNLDRAEHTVTEGHDGVVGGKARFDQYLDIDQTISVPFTEPDVYQVTCKFHPTMNMTVNVTP